MIDLPPVLLLDSMIVGAICFRRDRRHTELNQWLARMRQETRPCRLVLPEIADYECRRGIRHLALKNGRIDDPALTRLDDLKSELFYLPLNTRAMEHAAEIWAKAKHLGHAAARDESLGGDAILCAQAHDIRGAVLSDNKKHIEHFVRTYCWTELQALEH